MYCNEHEPLALLVDLTPKLAKKRFRESIYQAWDYKCGYCGDAATSLDHIIPRFKSGCSSRHNLLPACRKCNTNKASENMELWYKKQEYFNETKLDRIKHWMQASNFNIVDLETHRKTT
jgi:5-methylcytosine-specific restriction endonuclease McrA